MANAIGLKNGGISGAPPPPTRRVAPLKGILFLVAAVACFAALDTTTKWVTGTQEVPLMMALWVLFSIQFALYGALVFATGRAPLLRRAHARSQVLRGILLLGVQTLVFVSLSLMPVGEFTAVVMTTPLLVTLLAVPLLGETISFYRVLLVIGGFTGTLVIMRPGTQSVGWVLAVPLVLVLVNSGYQLLTSWMARTQDVLITLLCTSGVCFLLLSVLLFNFWTPVTDWASLGGLLLMGLAASAGNLLFVRAFECGTAGSLMPCMYLQIVFGMVGGWLVFDHMPDAPALLGIAMIAVFGMAAGMLSLREGRKAGPALIT